jgi:hypothetical protein
MEINFNRISVKKSRLSRPNLKLPRQHQREKKIFPYKNTSMNLEPYGSILSTT